MNADTERCGWIFLEPADQTSGKGNFHASSLGSDVLYDTRCDKWNHHRVRQQPHQPLCMITVSKSKRKPDTSNPPKKRWIITTSHTLCIRCVGCFEEGDVHQKNGTVRVSPGPPGDPKHHQLPPRAQTITETIDVDRLNTFERHDAPQTQPR